MADAAIADIHFHAHFHCARERCRSILVIADIADDG